MDSLWDQTHWEAFLPLATIYMSSNNQPAWPQTQSHPHPQQQPELHAMVPLGSKQSEVRKYTAEDWDAQRPEITRLYKSNTLNGVTEIMRERYGLDATAKQYKGRIKKWSLNKNIQPEEMEAMIRKQDRRLLESNKRSAFRVRKRPVPPEKISRYIKEHDIEPITANYDGNISGNTGSAATPAGISCYTPSDTGPLTPHAAPSPLATSNPQPSFSHQSPHSSSYQFGDPRPTLPSSPSVAQMTRSLHRQPLSPMPIAASPTPSFSAPIALDESTFTGQSPAPFSIPSTPQAYDHNVLQDRAMGVTYNGRDLHIVASVFSIACELVRQGKYRAAEKIHRQALELRQKELGPKHPDTLTSMSALARVLERQGRYRAAEQMNQQTLQLRQKVLGSEHPDTLLSMKWLAYVLEKQGRYRAAEKMDQETLQLMQKVLGPEHPETLASMSSLGLVLTRQGKYVEAEQMHWETLQLTQKVLGPEHTDTLVSMNNLGLLLSRQDKCVNAEQMHRQTLQLRQKVSGPAHPDTLMSIDNLGLALSGQGKYVEAEQMHQQTLQLRQKVLGPEHPDTLVSMSNLGIALSGQGKYVEAEQMYKQTLQLVQKVLGPEHPNTLMCMDNLGVALSRQGKYVDAEQMHQQTLQLRQKVLGPKHPYTLTSMRNLQLALRRQGKNIEADQIAHAQSKASSP